MIREVHKIVSDCNDWYDKYVVYYVSGRKREFIGVDQLPKTVAKFIKNSKRKFSLYYTTVNGRLVPNTICYDNN